MSLMDLKVGDTIVVFGEDVEFIKYTQYGIVARTKSGGVCAFGADNPFVYKK